MKATSLRSRARRPAFGRTGQAAGLCLGVMRIAHGAALLPLSTTPTQPRGQARTGVIVKLHRRLLGRCVLSALSCVPFAAIAEGTPITLGQVIVTATRTAQSEDQTLAPITVITREENELLQPSSLQDLLNDAPGMAISNQGGLGKVSAMFLRGTNANQVLVLVDGIRIGSATAGTPPNEDITVDHIQRNEIVRGPFSSLYRSEAIGGVIQIFQRHAPGT